MNCDPISTVSLGVALMFGTAGLPHILMRFFAMANAKDGKSVFYACGYVGYFCIFTFIIGFGAIIYLIQDPSISTSAQMAITTG